MSDGLREALAELADDFASNVDWSAGRDNYGDNGAWESAAREVRALIADHPATPAEEVAEVAVGLDFIKRLVGAWDCCGTCAGGVLAAHDAALTAKAKAEAWDEGFDRGFYDPLAGHGAYGHDASESAAVNPYEPR